MDGTLLAAEAHGRAATPAVELRGLRKVFPGRHGGVEAVAGVSLTVREGEFVAILGPSGCGKSTLLNLAAGLEAPTAGEVLIRGAAIAGPSRHVGIVFQDATLLPWKSVLENALYPARIRGLALPPVRARALELLDLVGLGSFAHHRPAQLSGGMRQRAALCRALAYDPAVLLLDEPFSALDAITRDEMGELLLAVWEGLGNAAVLVTHSIREALLLADRIVVMAARPSRVVAEIAVPFARPRGLEVTEEPRFARLSAELRGLIGSVGPAGGGRADFAARIARLAGRPA